MKDTENETMFDGMFTKKGNFKNTAENRKDIADEYGEELTNFALSRLSEGNTQNTQPPPKNQSSLKSEGASEVDTNPIKFETKNHQL